jgi:hypothetical protein
MNITKELILLARVVSEESEDGKMMNGSLRCKGRSHVSLRQTFGGSEERVEHDWSQQLGGEWLSSGW